MRQVRLTSISSLKPRQMLCGTLDMVAGGIFLPIGGGRGQPAIVHRGVDGGQCGWKWQFQDGGLSNWNAFQI
jgi:hypothetical protein